MLKTLVNAVAVAVVSPLAATCWLETRLMPRCERVFNFWTHVLALLPGYPGIFFRRAFYWLTLDQGSLTCTVDFGAFFSHRSARVEENVYIGSYAIIGSARLGAGCLIGSRASLLSGSGQHTLGSDNQWHLDTVLRQITIGSHVWIGEAALVMNDVGDGALVAAGTVVSGPVAAGVVVAGNPARFVRQVRPDVPPVAATGTGERDRGSLVHSAH